jgi:hypothetical protein
MTSLRYIPVTHILIIPARLHFFKSFLKNKNAKVDNDLKIVLKIINSVYLIGQNNIGCAKYWWIRHGTRDNHTSVTVITNLAISLENRNKEMNCWLYWDGGNCADEDTEDFIAWIGDITGFTIRK